MSMVYHIYVYDYVSPKPQTLLIIHEEKKKEKS